MSQHDVKCAPYRFASQGHAMGWKCIRCDKVRPLLGSQTRKYAGRMRKVCAVCVSELVA